ncbi:fibronectin type III domain-containing protein [Kineococcus sp. SYSU DK001]|uniref:fibronectin type III domain-containing protein n=1 Tax=Kineococcus sp. SYSU DK001 TaxID=3383122 RepID=UPI003D7D00C9
MNSLGARRSRRVATAALTALVVLFGLPAATTATAADPPAVPETVTADALPTVQVNGVVWAQTTVGNTVYVTGKFTSARPAGAPAGTGETPRSNILAYDLTTGKLITSFTASLNSEGLGITASPDGSRVYVVGNFTKANGENRYRIAALNAQTGALVPGFAAQVDYRARAVVATDDAVYVGGQFSVANKTARSRLAAFSPTNGSLLPWAPSADNEVFALVAPDGGSVVAAGRFATLNDGPAYGMGALDPVTGASAPWAATDVVRNAGAKAAIYSLATDGETVYGTGYQYQSGSAGNLEGSFAADAATGKLDWVVGCLGDSYSVQPLGGVVYTVGHAHDCSPVGGWPQANPQTFQHAMATTADARGTNTKGKFTGKPAPKLLNWWPTLNVGTFTGQSQAAWSVTGNAQYVSLGGEFPTVNGTKQQGLVRLAVRPVAPAEEGPRPLADLKPEVAVAGPGTVRLRWKATWDPESSDLQYRVVRDGDLAHPAGTLTAASTWWTRPNLEFTDTGLTPGTTYSYRVHAVDADGNSVASTAVTVDPSSSATPVTLATDTFGRTATSGWGTANSGGPWTTTGGNYNFSVYSGAGRVKAARGGTSTAVLGTVLATSADVQFTVAATPLPAPSAAVLTTLGRRVDAASDYRSAVRLVSGQPVQLTLTARVGGAQTTLASLAVPGLTATAGQKLQVRTQVTGVNPTTVRAKVWPAGTSEPAAWQVSATDTSPALQVAGNPGLSAALPGSANTSSVQATFDDLRVQTVAAGG